MHAWKQASAALAEYAAVPLTNALWPRKLAF